MRSADTIGHDGLTFFQFDRQIFVIWYNSKNKFYTLPSNNRNDVDIGRTFAIIHYREWHFKLNSPIQLFYNACSNLRLLGLLVLGCSFASYLPFPANGLPEQRTMAQAQLLAIPPVIAETPTAFTLFTRVAPIFVHGRGFGQSGWDAGDGSIFLSKEDACAMIIEQGRAAGLHFSQDAMTLNDILPVQGRPANESMPAPTRSLTLDGSDSQKKVAFVFVSAGDANNWRKKCGRGSLGEGVDIFGCASSIRDVLAGAPLDGYYAVFYDPAVTLDDLPTSAANDQNQQTGDLTNEAADYARTQLRQQVRDFIGWLKTRKN